MDINLEFLLSKNRLVIFCLVLFTILLYGNTLNFGFNFDDQLVSINHPLTSQGVKALPEIFTSHYYQDESGYAYEYRPVVLASFAIEHSLFGENPKVSHFINVALYATLIAVLFILLLNLFPQISILFHILVCVLFLAHPIHTEVVASIKNRDEILALLFGLLAWLAVVKAFDKERMILIALAFVLFVFGILSKLSVASFCVLIPFSIVLFRAPNKRQLFLLSFLLASVTSYVIPIPTLKMKLFYFISIVVAPFILLGVLRQLKAENSAFYYVKSFSLSVKELVAYIKANKLELPMIAVFIINVGLLIVGAIGIAFSLKLLTILPLVVFFILFFISSKNTKTFLFIGLSILLMASFYWLFTPLLVRYFLLFIIILFVLDIIPRVKINLVNIGVLILVSYFFIENEYIILLILFISRIFIPTKNALLLASILYFINFMVRLFTKDFMLEDSFVYPLLAFVALPLFIIVPIRKILISTALLSLFVLTFNEAQFKENLTENIRISEKLVTVLNTNTSGVLKNEERPLSYMESPVNSKSSLSIKLGTSFTILGKYIEKLIWPHPLGFYYGYAYIVPTPITNWYALTSLFVYSFLILIAFYFLRNKKIISFGIFCYLISIAMFSNLVYPVVGGIADRFSFIASLGFCIVIAWLFLKVFNIDLNNRLRVRINWLPIVLISFLVLTYSVKTIARNRLWKTPLTLMEHDIKYLKESVQAHNLLALNSFREYYTNPNTKLKEKYLNQAIKHFEKAVEIYPQFFNAQYDLGRAYFEKGDMNLAVKSFQKAIEINPEFTSSYVYIANILMNNNKFRAAIPYYEKALRYSTEKLELYNSIAFAYFKAEDFQKTIEVQKEAINFYPNSFDSWANIGKTYIRVNNIQEAIYSFEKAFELRKDINIALALFELHKELGNEEKAAYYHRIVKHN